MNKVVSAAVLTAAACLAMAPAIAQDKATPVEMYICQFNDGKDMKDLEKAHEKFRDWADERNLPYRAWTITPIFRSAASEDDEFEIGWMGAWADGNAMGQGMYQWANEGGNAAEAYLDVIDCAQNHSLMTSVVVNAPESPSTNGIVLFSSCTIHEDKNWKDAMEAHQAAAKMMDTKGGTASSWMFWPSLGTPGEMKFDYYSVVGFNSYGDMGKNWEIYNNGGGWEASMGELSKATSCNTPRAYEARLVHGGPSS